MCREVRNRWGKHPSSLCLAQEEKREVKARQVEGEGHRVAENVSVNIVNDDRLCYNSMNYR